MQTIPQLIQDTIHPAVRKPMKQPRPPQMPYRHKLHQALTSPRPPSLIVPDTKSATHAVAVVTHAVAVTFISPFQDILAQYIKEIQSGEFFDLIKLLSNNLQLYDEDNNLVLSLDNSVVKVSRKSKPTPSTSIAKIEQWTMAFTSYTSKLIHKFPIQSQELLQHVSLTRYAVYKVGQAGPSMTSSHTIKLVSTSLQMGQLVLINNYLTKNYQFFAIMYFNIYVLCNGYFTFSNKSRWNHSQLLVFEISASSEVLIICVSLATFTPCYDT